MTNKIDFGAATNAQRDAAWEREPKPDPLFPDPMSEDALHGVVGEFVRAVAPGTEASADAILVQFLAAAGNVIGRSPFVIGGDRHQAQVFALVVGATAKARKGSSWGVVDRFMRQADPTFDTRYVSGLATGEGVIFHLRDPSGEGKKADPGVHDKRLLVVEPEFAGPLRKMSREGSTLSATIRSAWDGLPLGNLTKSSPHRATNTHLSIIGHITAAELRAELDDTAQVDGFANRFLWVAAHRSKRLPMGGIRYDLSRLAHRVGETLAHARDADEVVIATEAEAEWVSMYNAECDAERGPQVDSLTARGAPYMKRLALIYALLDRSTTIRVPHLRAASAVWRYSVASARWALAAGTGDKVADRVLQALRQAPAGLSRTEVSAALNRNVPGPDLERALSTLAAQGLAAAERGVGAGTKPVERWAATS